MKRKLSSKGNAAKRRKVSKYFGRLVKESDKITREPCSNCNSCALLDKDFVIPTCHARILNPMMTQDNNGSDLDRVYIRPFDKHVFSQVVIGEALNLHLWATYWIGPRSLYSFPSSFVEESKKSNQVPLGGWCLSTARSHAPPERSKINNSLVECVLKWSILSESEKNKRTWSLVVGQVPASKGERSQLSYFPLSGWIQLAALAWQLPGATLPQNVVTVSDEHISKYHSDCDCEVSR